MADSKTARASQVKTIKEVHVETIDEAIKAIRDNRAAGLFIGDMSRVDKLLQAYDSAMADIRAREASAAAQEKKTEDFGKLGEALVEAVPEFIHQGIQMKDVDFEHGDQT